jgi:hypothetical protein
MVPVIPAVRGNDPLLNLCSHLVAEPERLTRAHVFPVQRVHKAPHAHDDILQIDLAIGCSGGWTVDGQIRPILGTTLVAFYPAEQHAYRADTAGPGSVIFSLKVRIQKHWLAIAGRIFPSTWRNCRRSRSLCGPGSD